MSSTAISLSAGLQKLFDSGLLPDSISQETLNSASTAQLNQLARSTVALQQASVLLGQGEVSDSVSLSSDAVSALLQDNSSGDTPSAADFFTQAVNNQLTNNVNSAVSTFLPSASTPSGIHVNVVG